MRSPLRLGLRLFADGGDVDVAPLQHRIEDTVGEFVGRVVDLGGLPELAGIADKLADMVACEVSTGDDGGDQVESPFGVVGMQLPQRPVQFSTVGVGELVKGRQQQVDGVAASGDAPVEPLVEVRGVRGQRTVTGSGHELVGDLVQRAALCRAKILWAMSCATAARTGAAGPLPRSLGHHP